MDPKLYLIAINAVTFLLYWHDKRAARRAGAARVPEYVLLLVGFLGGTVAAVVGQQMLRHKTKKSSFQFKFWALTLLQLVLLFAPPVALKMLLTRLFA